MINPILLSVLLSVLFLSTPAFGQLVKSVSEPTIIAFDRSGSMGRNKTGSAYVALYDAWDELRELGPMRLVTLNNGPHTVSAWDVTERWQLRRATVTPNSGDTDIGATLKQLTEKAKTMCPSYIVLVNETPHDPDVFKEAMAKLSQHTTVMILVLRYGDYVAAKEWYENEVVTVATYQVRLLSTESVRAAARAIVGLGGCLLS